MDAATQTELAINTARGRKEKDGTEAVPKTKPIRENIDDMLALMKKLEDMRTKVNDKFKIIAEQAGMQTKVVRKWFKAKHAGDEAIAEMQREHEQMQMILDECDE